MIVSTMRVKASRGSSSSERDVDTAERGKITDQK